MRSFRPRRGSNALEFALLLPVFVALLAVVFEYGWYFFIRAAVASSVREGCRAGAVIPPDDAPGPVDVAETSIQEGLSRYTFFGIDCGNSEESRCDIDVSNTGTSPSQTLQCSINLAYPGLTGAIPVPEQVISQAIAILEVQD